MRTLTLALSLTLAPAALVSTGCSSYRESRNSESFEQRIQREAVDARTAFRQKDPTIIDYFQNSYGYAMFPKVTKGAAGIGAAHGDGAVYEQGKLVGYADVTQVNIGFQLGGQSFSQVIFFQDERALTKFKRGTLEFSANASAVAVESGVAASNDYSDGVAVFSMIRGGLMYEASIGGQNFDYRPAN